MTLTISIGWWIAPMVVTLICFGWATFVGMTDEPDQYGVGSIIALGFYMAVAVVSLLAWLIWALLA